MQERNIRQQEQSRADRSAAEAAAAKGEIAALKAQKKTLAEQVLSQEAQVTHCTRSQIDDCPPAENSVLTMIKM